MAKTALELTPAEQMVYRPSTIIGQRLRTGDPLTDERWQQAQLLARQAAKLLREDFGASRVCLFGSATHRPRFTRWSDIDLAVWGLPPERLYAAVAAVTGISAEIEGDLGDAAALQSAMRLANEGDGTDL